MKRHIFAVLDDDPTGIQTVHGCLLITDTKPETVKQVLEDESSFFYVLTNTRAHGPEEADAIIGEAVRAILPAAALRDLDVSFISRSDSTLRSHFPVEIDAIERVSSEHGRPAPDAVFLIPAFFEGGRLTKDDTHFMKTESGLIPTSHSEFAKDSVFGYSTSYLPGYIEEKTGIPAAEVSGISLNDIRGDSGALTGKLCGLTNKRMAVVNAETYEDLDLFCRALHTAMDKGRRFLFQSAASFVKSVTGTPSKPLLNASDFAHTGDAGEAPGGSSERDRGSEVRAGTGLVIVGSHVEKTTRQVNILLKQEGILGIEIDAETVLQRGKTYLPDIGRRIDSARMEGFTPVAYTSRRELSFTCREARIRAGKVISSFIVSLAAAAMESRAGIPAFLIAKGGITSHDILTRGLGVSVARVAGQVLPGVPALRIAWESTILPYVIFPGNVGDDDSLAQVYRRLFTPGPGHGAGV